jgi:hypothetical protein
MRKSAAHLTLLVTPFFEGVTRRHAMPTGRPSIGTR